MSESQTAYNALSVIDGVDINEAAVTMAKIGQFQQLVQKQLRQNHDFGVIPGTPKPTLLKPGAEKILMLLGLRSEFDIADATRDFDKAFFQYQVKCTLYKGDMLITQGLGAANNRESRYKKQDPYTVDNTVLKMAKKRALIDATLLVASLSDIFNQDLDDIDISGNRTTGKKRYATDQDGKINKQEAKELFALADGDQEVVKAALAEFKHERTDQITKLEYNDICACVSELRAAKLAAEIPGDFSGSEDAAPAEDKPKEEKAAK